MMQKYMLGKGGKGRRERDSLETYLDTTSPRNAFSFAMSGGLKVDCAFAKCVNPTGESDIFSVADVEGLEDFLLSLLVKEPIISD
jgi:hypothetical protein